MNKTTLLNNLAKVEKLAKASKFQRLLANPYKYIFSIAHRELFYKSNGKAISKTTNTFFDHSMNILLPASIDIYLTRGKSHESEIRLARFLIHNLQAGDCFIDVGAHYGYFTLLAAELVQEKGRVLSYEAAPSSFNLLKDNTNAIQHIDIRNQAVSSASGHIEFYQFPNLYSEYNSINSTQFEKEDWFQKAKPEKIVAESIALTQVFSAENINPQIIKIDVEGAEHEVIKGLQNFLDSNAPQIVMEYLISKSDSSPHGEAALLLYNKNYKAFKIKQDGQLELCTDIEDYMKGNQLTSDNIVFKK